MMKINKKYLTGSLVFLCLSFGYLALQSWRTEIYLCKGEIVNTDSSLRYDDKVAKAPIEFGFSWDKFTEKLEVSTIGDLTSISNLINKSYPSETEVILNDASSNDKNISFTYIGDGYSKDQHVSAEFDFDRIANYLLIKYSMSDNGGKGWFRTTEFRVTAKCIRKWY